MSVKKSQDYVEVEDVLITKDHTNASVLQVTNWLPTNNHAKISMNVLELVEFAPMEFVKT